MTEHAGFRGGPNVDGWVLPRQIVDTFDRKEEALVPVLMGFNRNEIYPVLMGFMLATICRLRATSYEAEIHKRYSDLAAEFLRLYPSSDIKGSMMAASRDAIFGWSAERIVRDEAKAGMPSYLYFFDHGYPAAEARGFHAFHGSEMPYTFGHVDKDAILPANWPAPEGPKEIAFSDAMIAYWTSFARTGVPKAPGQPDWPSLCAQQELHAFRGDTRTLDRSDARHVRAERGGHAARAARRRSGMVGQCRPYGSGAFEPGAGALKPQARKREYREAMQIMEKNEAPPRVV